MHIKIVKSRNIFPSFIRYALNNFAFSGRSDMIYSLFIKWFRSNRTMRYNSFTIHKMMSQQPSGVIRFIRYAPNDFATTERCDIIHSRFIRWCRNNRAMLYDLFVMHQMISQQPSSVIWFTGYSLNDLAKKNKKNSVVILSFVIHQIISHNRDVGYHLFIIY